MPPRVRRIFVLLAGCVLAEPAAARAHVERWLGSRKDLASA
jgi:hypothetical protein